jgi:putative SOS response-associated peptidase YedK
MPVILPDELVDEWLDPKQDDLERLWRLLVPAALSPPKPPI